MSKSNIKKNFFYQMVYQILILVLPFVTSPYIARVIGAEGLGIYSYTSTIAYYFILFSMLGLSNYGNRIIAKVRDNREERNQVFSNLAGLHIIISILVLFVYECYVVVIAENQFLAMVQTAYVLSGLFDISWFYFGIEEFKFTVIRNVIVKVITVACIFAFVHTADNLWIYCLIMAFSHLISQLVLWIPLKRHVDLKKPCFQEMMHHLRPLLVLFLPAIAVSLYKYMDKVMIGALSSKAELGFYENAEKLVNMPLSIIAAFGTVMLPRMSNLAANRNLKEVSKYMNLSMNYIMCIAFAMAFGLAGIAGNFAPLFWGEAFAKSGVIIIGLSITIPFISFANIIRTEYLIPFERDREYLISVICGAAVNFIINCFLIPSIGSIGATIGTVTAEILVCLVQIFCVRKELPIGQYIRNTIAYFLFGCIMLFVVHKIGNQFALSLWGICFQIASGVLISSATTLAYWEYTKDPMLLQIRTKMKRKNMK